jgi:hypothetical protein
MAEEQKDWRGYIQRYCKAGGIQYYPLWIIERTFFLVNGFISK